MIVVEAQRVLKEWIDNIEQIYDKKYEEIEEQFAERLETLIKMADENHKQLQEEIIHLKDNMITKLKRDNESLSQRVHELENRISSMTGKVNTNHAKVIEENIAIYNSQDNYDKMDVYRLCIIDDMHP